MTETFGKLGCLSLATMGSGGMAAQPLDDEALELVTLMDVTELHPGGAAEAGLGSEGPH